jgi:hypothetical protein
LTIFNILEKHEQSYLALKYITESNVTHEDFNLFDLKLLKICPAIEIRYQNMINTFNLNPENLLNENKFFQYDSNTIKTKLE